MALIVTPLYAGLSGVLLTGLSINVSRLRMKLQVHLGDGSAQIAKVAEDEKEEATKKYQPLATAIRAQGNFVEYVPFAILLLAVSEAQGLSQTAIHAIGSALIAARLAHINTIVGSSTTLGFGRTGGTIVTLSIILGLAGRLIFNALKKN